ncbi:Transposase DDE domain protein [Gemmata obscuriglobus]|uniref:transposase n=1 Tax=Gemmata obscuriglobus TaxID=114 RepID=UPI00016C352C|nr:transposase [Gemmata obscuriglobus]QEG26546.1 Transposase DDE domain protein [Gemmata obscuriglobus]QEG26890.1 Transposase DDE domain protein [Gemmata obscuriglobus]QEG27550.1 Transposase DDE domain protein [Gemmata obscuriglobus]QEG28175.1 Transposase DDE domain protein [Gemmata obscuriglobus]QEG28516.1 Transposase DDE domain protein [Gemmata obscuriglobus]
MRPKRQSIRATPAHATRHLRPVLTDWLGRAVQLPKRRRTCTPEVVWRVVLFAAAFARSVAAACAAIADAPSGQAIWDCLYLTLPKRRRTLERRLRPALHAPLGKRKRAARVAIDYHRIGYFGTPNRDTTRSKGAGGTHTFHTYATACLVGGPDRYTLGLTAVGEKEPMTAVLTRLLDQVTAARVTVRVALLDKAFFSIAVMRLLQARGVPFVIPAVVRGRKPRPGVKGVGLRAVRRRGAGRYAYTHADRGTSVRVHVVIAHKSYRYRRTGGRRSKKLLYAAWRVSGSPVAIRDLYRTRFGIESSYRQLGQVRPRTSTTDGVVRLLWVAVGLILRNAWLWSRSARGLGWTLAAVCLILLADGLAPTDGENKSITTARSANKTKPPT